MAASRTAGAPPMQAPHDAEGEHDFAEMQRQQAMMQRQQQPAQMPPMQQMGGGGGDDDDEGASSLFAGLVGKLLRRRGDDAKGGAGTAHRAFSIGFAPSLADVPVPGPGGRGARRK